MVFPRILRASAILGALLLLTSSCEETVETLGENVTGESPFVTDKAAFDVFAFNKKIAAVQTNQLPLYQLGTFDDPVYGTRNARIVSEVTLLGENPVFGNASQEDEDNTNTDENETVKEVFLYIPYQSSPSSSEDSDGARFVLDSIFGNRDQPFTLTVSKSTFFSTLDPDSSFETAPEFYSNFDFSDTLEGAPLFEGEETISDEEIVINEEDDPETEEDESTQEKLRLNPGIRIPLDNTVFQEILDREGDDVLLNRDNFKAFFNSIHIEATAAEALMFLLDLTQANITMTYTYQDQNTGETAEEDVVFGLLVNIGTLLGNAVNTFEDTNFPTGITQDENAERIFVKGGATLAEIRLFGATEEDAAARIEEIRANNWVVNEAFLIFHVDRETLDNAGGTVLEPPRLYLYNAETDEPLYNVATETSASNDPLGLFLTYDGLLQEENGLGIQYRIRITEYLNDIIVRGAKNATLALTQTSNVAITAVRETVEDDGEATEDDKISINMPTMAVISPLGTVLFGSEVDATHEDKKLKLEIFYTEAD